MKKRYLGIIFLILFISVQCFAGIDILQLQEIPNVTLLEEDIIGGGKPTEADLIKAKALGVKTVIDLRTLFEGTESEKKFAEEIGLIYFNVPVASMKIQDNQVEAVAKILENQDNRPVLIHCAVGGRVWALWEKYRQNKKSKK